MNEDTSVFQSIIKFNDECETEIQKLVEFSSSNQEYIQLYISSAVVLLGAKFESCIESLVEEYVEKINSETNKERIPDILKYSSIYNKLSTYQEKIKKSHFDCFSLNVDYLEEFSSFVSSIINNTEDLKINNKFSYSTHGYNELVKLLKNIAINITDDEFNKFVIDGLFEGVSQEISFKDEFNRFTNNRNTVVHQNTCPNITGEDILGTADAFKKFIFKIGEELSTRLEIMR
jgi:hypothetical protein